MQCDAILDDSSKNEYQVGNIDVFNCIPRKLKSLNKNLNFPDNIR